MASYNWLDKHLWPFGATFNGRILCKYSFLVCDYILTLKFSCQGLYTNHGSRVWNYLFSSGCRFAQLPAERPSTCLGARSKRIYVVVFTRYPAIVKFLENIFLWCVYITYNGYPYNTNPIEHHLGLVFANDTIKPGYSFYVSFANNLVKGVIPVPPPPSPSAIGIYWPDMVCRFLLMKRDE